VVSSGCQDKGWIKDVNFIAKVTQEEIDTAMADKGLTQLTGLAECDVKLFQIEYESVGVNGEPVDLSAAFSIPVGPGCDGPFPLLADGHGTRTKAGYTEASVENMMLDHAIFTSHGYVSVNVDYVGLGTSDYDYHPFLHRDSEARSMIDGLRAARHMALALGVELSGKVMLKGFSQGGHTAMATQREIEANYLDEFDLVASAPMAGPFELEATFVDAFNTPAIPNSSAGVLFSYTLQSYQNIYGTMYDELSDVALPSSEPIIANGFPGELSVLEFIMSGLLPNDPTLALQADFIDDFVSGVHPMREALAQNEVSDFIPQTPMMLCSSRYDGVVPHFNSEYAQAKFFAGGAQVPLVDVADFIPEIPGQDSGLVHHLSAKPICYATIKNQFFDLLK